MRRECLAGGSPTYLRAVKQAAGTSGPQPWEKFRSAIPDLLAEYESRLRMMRSALTSDAETWLGCRQHAEVVLAECAISLREQRVVSSDRDWQLASELGAHRAARNIHPTESLRASSMLIELVIRLLDRVVGEDPRGVRMMTPALLTLNGSIAARMEIASISYDRYLFDQIKQAQTETYRAMAREIHDHVGNGVSLASRQLDLYDVLHARDRVAAHDKVVLARRALSETLNSTRRLVAELRLRIPPTRIRDAIELFVKSVDDPNTTVNVVLTGDERWIPEEVCGELFTVIREGLRNIFKYAAASVATVRLDITPWQAHATVEDNGVGFTPDAPSDGHGLAAMAERADLLGGSFEITSRRGAGTRLDVRIPLTEPKHDQAG